MARTIAIFVITFGISLLLGPAGALSQKNTPDIKQKAEQGDAEAQFMMGISYKTGLAGMIAGTGAKVDYKEALKWFTKAAEQGDGRACNEIGLIYANGWDVRKDPKEAFKWFHESAKHGIAPGMNNLGRLYELGYGTRKNFGEAFKWYRKAAEAGHAEAQVNLGTMYLKGLGVTEDRKQALDWYRKAAEKGNAEAKKKMELLK